MAVGFNTSTAWQETSTPGTQEHPATVSLPSGNSGKRLVMIISTENQNVTTADPIDTPSGWHEVFQSEYPTTVSVAGIAVFTRMGNGDSTVDVSTNGTETVIWGAIVIMLDDAHETDASSYDTVTAANENTATATSVDSPSITPSEDDTIAIIFAYADADNVANSSTDNTPASNGFTTLASADDFLIVDRGSGGGNGMCMVAAYKVIGTAAATGAQTWDWVSAEECLGATLIFKSAAPAGGQVGNTFVGLGGDYGPGLVRAAA